MIALVDFDLPLTDEAAKVGVGIGGGVEFSIRPFEIGNQLVRFVDIRNGAAEGAGNAADHSLGPPLLEHFTGIGIVGMDDHSIGDVAASLGVGVGWRKMNLGVDPGDALFGISGLNGMVGAFGNADPAHREKPGRGLGMLGSQAAFSGAAAESLTSLAGFEGNDVHPLLRGINDVEQLGIVVGVTGLALVGDEGLHVVPVKFAGFGW